MSHEIIFREQYGTLGEERVYIKPSGRFLVVVLDNWIQEHKCQATRFKLYPFFSYWKYNERFIGRRVCFVIGLLQIKSWCGYSLSQAFPSET
jgi:hypothetical protein